MASGYEKAECGVDPNTGWGTPSRVENAILLAVGIAGAIAFFATKAVVAIHLVTWLAR